MYSLIENTFSALFAKGLARYQRSVLLDDLARDPRRLEDLGLTLEEMTEALLLSEPRLGDLIAQRTGDWRYSTRVPAAGGRRS